MALAPEQAAALYVPTAARLGLGAASGITGPLRSLLLSAAAEPDDLGRLHAYLKELTRFCGSHGLWATQQLTANCGLLVRTAIGSNSKDELEKAAATLRAAFKVALVDNEDEEEKQGRTQQCYALAVCLLTVYVRMRAYPLAEGILQATTQYERNIPPLTDSDPQVQTRFLFYKGCLHFFKLEYVPAAAAFARCLEVADFRLPRPEFERIMAFYIPAQYNASHQVPTDAVWRALPRLRHLYQPLLAASRAGNWAAFSATLTSRRAFFSRNRLLLAFEAMARILKVNLLLRVWRARARPKRLALEDYAAALSASRAIPPSVPALEAAEFYIAQMVADGEVKGYIHDEFRLLLLSKSGPFPRVAAGVAASDAA